MRRRPYPKPGEGHPQRADQKAARVVRLLSRLAVVGMVVAVGLIVRSYDFERLDDAQWTPLEGKDGLARGSYLIFKGVEGGTVIGVGSLVEARVSVPPRLAKRLGQDEGLILTEVAGTPGMAITFELQEDGRVELLLDGASIQARMELPRQLDVPHHLQVREGPIPDGYYLLINPNVDADAIDSRLVGLIARDRLLRKASYL